MSAKRDAGDGLLRPRVINGAQVGWVAALWVNGKRVWRYGPSKAAAKAKLVELQRARDGLRPAEDC